MKNFGDTIHKQRHLFKADDTLQKLFPRNYIFVENKKRKNLQELLTRADPYNVKSNLFDLKDHGYKSCHKRGSSWDNFVNKTFFVISKEISD